MAIFTYKVMGCGLFWWDGTKTFMLWLEMSGFEREGDDVMQRNRKRGKRRLSEERCPFTTTMPLRKQYKRLHWYSHYFHFLASCPSQWPQTFCPDFKWSILSAINTFAFRHHFCFVHMQWSQDSQIIDWDKITNCSAVSIFKKKL